MLSVFAVTNLSDGQVSEILHMPGSLRQAIYDANANPGDDTITFDSSLANQTITLDWGELGLTDTAGKTTITGLGADQLTVSGKNFSRVFVIFGGVSADISGLTITQGYTGWYPEWGGGIANRGTLTLTDCTISGNRASSSGGGISNGGTLTITGSTISGNSAEKWGGGIGNGVSLTLTASTIAGKSAEN